MSAAARVTLRVYEPRELESPAQSIRCPALHGTMPAHQCVSSASRMERRPLGCAGCATGATVRAVLGAPEPLPLPPPSPEETEAFELPRRARSPLGSERELRQRGNGALTARELAEGVGLLCDLRAGFGGHAASMRATGLAHNTLARAARGDMTLATLVVLRDTHARLRRCTGCRSVLAASDAGPQCGRCAGVSIKEPTTWEVWAARPRRTA